MNRIRRTGILLCSLLLAAHAGVASAVTRWEMALAYPANIYHSENAAAFASCVGKTSRGELLITPRPGGTLLRGREIKPALQAGHVPIGERLLAAHEHEQALYGIDSRPFLTRSPEEAERLWKAALPALKRTLESENLVYLYSVPWPPQGLYLNHPAQTLADLRGLKLRTYNASLARFAELAGMTPTRLPAYDLARGFSNGTIDAMLSSAATGYEGQLWRYISHFYSTDAWMPRNTIVANRDAWDALGRSSRRALLKCAATAAREGYERMRSYDAMTREGLREAGMTVVEPSPELAAALHEIGNRLADEWAEKAGPEAVAVLRAYRRH